MSGKAGKHDVWVLAIAASLFMLTGFVVAPMRITDPLVLGYIGSIAGGVAGGAMTVLAGWLAWLAAQKQIAAQQEQLRLMQLQIELASDERRRRLIALLNRADESMKGPIEETGAVLNNIRQDIEDGEGTFTGFGLLINPVLDWSDYPLDNEQAWHLPIEIQRAIRHARQVTDHCSRWCGELINHGQDCDRDFSRANEALIKARREIRKKLVELEAQDLSPYPAALPAAPPAP